MLDAICQHYHVDGYAPYRDLPKKVQEIFLHGSGEESIKFYFERDDHRHYYRRPFEGVIPSLERRYRETESYMIREEIEKFLSLQACPACKGARLKPVPLAVTLHHLPIHELTALSIEKTYDFFQDLQLDPKERAIAERLLKEIRERLWFLKRRPRLPFLGQAASTLSGGEDQRIRLATQIGSGLAGVLYVLDEPASAFTRGQSPAPPEPETIRDLGNTVLVVEHDAGPSFLGFRR
jgi:excinuclease ABC subunit A